MFTFLLSLVFLHHVESYRQRDPVLVEQLERSFYVDDLIISIDTRGEAEDFKQKATQLMKDGQFELRRWRFNLRELDQIWTSYENKTSSVLGLRWNVHSDTLAVPFSPVETAPPNQWTKRILASILARLYDPVGFSSQFPLHKGNFSSLRGEHHPNGMARYLFDCRHQHYECPGIVKKFPT